MKSIVKCLVFLALVSVGLPIYATNFTVDASLDSLDLLVGKSPDGQVHIIKNFDESYFNYSESINGNTIRLVSDAQVGMNTNNGRITYLKDRRNNLVVDVDDRARVIVQVPDGARIRFVSVKGGITVNDVDCASIDVEMIHGDFTLNRSDCDSIKMDMMNGSIYYTGRIEGKSIGLETINGNINIDLEEAGSDVDVDIQSNYSYRQRSFGTERIGYSTGRITNKRGAGLINAVTRNGTINCNVLY